MASGDAGEGPSGLRSSTAGRRTAASAGTSATGEGERVAEHLSLKDFRQLLKLLKINLPRNVLNDDVIRKSRNFRTTADIIVKKLKRKELRLVVKPRLQCRKVYQALKLKIKFGEMTEMIFFQKRKSNEKTLKEKWEKIPLSTRRGLRMRKTFGSRSAVGEKMRKLKTQSQSTEMKCLHYFIRRKKLSNVQYRREHAAEFGFLSGRMDFLLKKKGNSPKTSEYIMLKCKGTKKNLQSMIINKGGVSKLDLDNKYYCQTQAYLYLLEKTKPHADSVRAAVILKENEDEDDEDDMDDTDEEETDEETDEEEYESQDNEKVFKEYKVNEKQPKGKFLSESVLLTIDTKRFEELCEHCEKRAFPLYLAVLDKIFEKFEKKKGGKRNPINK